MRLVHEKKDRSGCWEVAWMWLPHFLTADVALHRFVDKRMTEKFRSRMGDKEALADEMHLAVIDLIVEKYPIKGLRQLLGSYSEVSIDETGSS